MGIFFAVSILLCLQRWGGGDVFFDLDFLSPDSGVVFSKMFEGDLLLLQLTAGLCFL